LVEESLLSNARFAESYVFYRRNKGYGPLRIRAELMSRGIAEDLIEHHLNIADNAWLVTMRHAWQKRFKGSLPDDFKTRAKHLRFLQYRGFTADHINSIFEDAGHD